MKKTILITGISVYLGSHLAYAFSKDFKIVGLKLKRSNSKKLSKIINAIELYNVEENGIIKVFDNQKINVIIHCATNYGRNEESFLNIIDANIYFPLKLLKLAIDNRVDCFINTDTILNKFISEYALSKKHFKDWLQFYSNKIKVINLILEHFYGPFDGPNKFISCIIEKILANEKEIHLTKGEQERDFLYIDDLVNAYKIILNNLESIKNNFTEFEIGSGKTITIKQIVTLIKKFSNNDRTKLNFGAIPYREKEKMKSECNIDKIKQLGWEPEISIQEGVKKIIELEKTRCSDQK